MLEFSVEDFVKSNVQIVPIVTLPLHIQLSEDSPLDLDVIKLHEGIERVQATCIRPIEVAAGSQAISKVYVFESPGLLGIGGKVWDSSFVLVDYCSRHCQDLIKNKVVLELGCGTGITGLSISYFAPNKVIMTDMEDVVPLLDLNINLHKKLCDGRFQCQELLGQSYLWGSSFYDNDNELNQLGKLFSECDTIIASDVVYYPEGYEPLVRSIVDLLTLPCSSSSSSKRIMILAHRHRHPQDREFFDMIHAQVDLRMTEIYWKEDYFRGKNMTNLEGSLQDVRLFSLEII